MLTAVAQPAQNVSLHVSVTWHPIASPTFAQIPSVDVRTNYRLERREKKRVSILALSCNDGLQNQDETDIDCGGLQCTRCAANQSCAIDHDCKTGFCSSNTCQGKIDLVSIEYPANHDFCTAVPTCNDGVKNQDETDIDCGGKHCVQCIEHHSCLLGRDCTTGYCESDTCKGSYRAQA